MNKFFKGITLSLAVFATVAATCAPASADEFYRHRRHNNNGGDALAAGAVGLIAGALIGGALSQPREPRRVYIDPPVYQDPQPIYGSQIDDDLYNQPDPYYAQPRRVYNAPVLSNGYYQQPRVIIRQQVYQRPVEIYRAPVRRAPVYSNYGALQPWTPEWYDYCSARYRSFDPQSGTFRGRKGRVYFCQAG